MFALGELVRELKAPDEGGMEGRVVAVYSVSAGLDPDQEVYVQPKGTTAVEAQVRIMASDLMLADKQLKQTSKYGFELVNA